MDAGTTNIKRGSSPKSAIGCPYPLTRFNMDLITRTILGYTAEVVGVNPDDITSSVKTRELVLARSIFADIAYSEYLYTYSHIGRILKRNHATVMHNLEILANDMRSRPELKFLRAQVFNRTKDFLQHS
jgi:chromosomal replication initiation ATPase DnaA